MFYKCSLLESLPDISKWNLNNAIFLNGLFFNCSSLISLPDLSKWDLFNSNIHNNELDLKLFSKLSLENYIKDIILFSAFYFKNDDLYLENIMLQMPKLKSNKKEELKNIFLS